MTETTRRPLWVDVVLLVLAGVMVIVLILLGNWQMQRLSWKRGLIAAVEARVHLPSKPVPSGSITQEDHAYLPVKLQGVFRHDLTRRVKAVTELGGGYWIMTPLANPSQTIWVNRGFAPIGAKVSAPPGAVEVMGLLRISEPKGTFFEQNDPDADRWVSRDVEALSRAAGLVDAAPYFVDSRINGASTDWPRAGLTKVNFRNTHLSYAITWYAMALLLIGGIAAAVLDRKRTYRSSE